MMMIIIIIIIIIIPQAMMKRIDPKAHKNMTNILV